MNLVKKYYPYITGLFVFIIYLFTLAPSVVEIDAGELATVICTLGIAHPTGYPLFTLLGHLFTLIPLPMSSIFKVNLFGAFNCAAAVTVFILISKTVLENINVFEALSIKPNSKESRKGRKTEKSSQESLLPVLTDGIKMLASIFGGLILAFNRTFWAQSTSIEVYSLHTFLILLVIYFLIKAFIDGSSSLTFSLKDKWMLFSVFLALSFSNHMTTLFILPGIAYLYFTKNKFTAVSFKKIGYMLAIFFPILIAIYSYIPIRASFNPIMNWSNATNMERLLRHISGKQYQVWLFSSFDAAQKQFSHFIEILFGNYSGSVINFGEFNITLFIVLAGIIAAYKYAKKFWVFLTITFLFTVAYAINYDIVDIDSYFLLAFIALSFFSVFGTIWLFTALKSEKYSYTIPAVVVIGFVLIECSINFRENNENDVYIFEDYTKALLGSTDKDALILSYQWDYFLSASYYFQNVENYRKDISVVDKELLRRSWYFNQLERSHPGLISRIQPTVDVFLSALVPFERSENFDSQILETYYRKIMTELISSNVEKRSVYIGPELIENEMHNGSFSLPEGYALIPDLFLFKVVKQNSRYIPARNPDFNIRLPYKLTKYTNIIETMTGSMLVRRALYELQYNKLDKAKLYAAKVRKDFPDYTIPEELSKAIGGN